MIPIEQILNNSYVNDQQIFQPTQVQPKFHIQDQSFLNVLLLHPFQQEHSCRHKLQIIQSQGSSRQEYPTYTEQMVKRDEKNEKNKKKFKKSNRNIIRKNLPKFILKEFRQHIGIKKRLYEGHQNQFFRTKIFLDSILKEKRQGITNISLANLKQIFGGGDKQQRTKGAKRKHLNRIAMRQLIAEKTLTILLKSRIPDKNWLLYYRGLKIYSYRLISESLCDRTQLH